jgi:hypothetical protein
MKYTKEQIKEMRDMLIDNAMESIRDGDFDAETIAREGFVGYDDRDDERIIYEFENSIGDDYFDV